MRRRAERAAFPLASRRSRRVLVAAVTALLLAGAAACQKSPEERLADVRALHEIGAWEESVEELRGILETHPDHPEASYLLGISQLRLGQPSLAVWPLELASRDPVMATKADLGLAGVYLRLDQREAALDAADRVLQAAERPEDREAALRVRVGVNLSRREWEAALEDAERLLELAPQDRSALAMRASALVGAGRPEEAGGILRSIWENASPENAQAAARAGLGLVRLYADELEDPEAAEEQLLEVLERFPTDRGVLRLAVDFYDERDEAERATAVLERALEQEPADLELRSLVADRMAERGLADRGEAILEEGAELLGSASAWFALAEFRRRQGDPVLALEAMERAVELVPAPTDILAFRYGDLLATNGRLEEAEAIAAGLSESTYRDVLRGRLAVERGEYERALEFLDRGLQRWPNNAGARYLAGRAAYALGQVERAVSEFREAVRAEPGATDAGIDLARIHLARGEPRLAGEFAGRTLRAVRDEEEGARLRSALAVTAEAQMELEAWEPARRNLDHLAKLEGGALPAALGHAALALRREGPDAAARRLAEAELDLTDPAHEEALRALSRYLLEAGAPERALDHVDRALTAHPEAASFHDLRGRILFNAGRVEEALAAFERALELDADLGPALEGLSLLVEAAGDGARARELAERAAEVQPENAGYAYRVGRLALAAGEQQEARRWMREALERDPLHAQANNDLAWILATGGERLDEALVRARRAAATLRSANVLDTLGWVHLQREEDEEAAEVLEEAHGLEPGSASIAYRLSLALAGTGHEDRARDLLRGALDSGAFPEAEQAREQLARLGGGES